MRDNTARRALEIDIGGLYGSRSSVSTGEGGIDGAALTQADLCAMKEIDGDMRREAGLRHRAVLKHGVLLPTAPTEAQAQLAAGGPDARRGLSHAAT